MRGSLFMAGFLVFAFGIILLLPSIILSSSDSKIQTKGQAISVIAGNVVEELSNNDSAGIAGRLPALLVVIGLALIAISFFVGF